MLDFCFSNAVVQNPVCQRLFVASMDHFDSLITEAMAMKPCDENSLRDRLPLDSVPFLCAKKLKVNFNDLAKDHDFRLSFQALFLFLLRKRIPIACKYIVR